MNKSESPRPHTGPDVRDLRDEELEAVHGGAKGPVWLRLLASTMGEAATRQAQKL